LDRLGVNGRQCLLLAVCQVRETPIHHLSLLGETLTLFLTQVQTWLYIYICAYARFLKRWVRELRF
jgi:hypothetical protein